MSKAFRAMNRLLVTLSQSIAPRVCDDCEGGSGMAYNPDLRAVVRCASCAGTGVNSTPASDRENHLGNALNTGEPRRTNPRSAA